MKNYNHLNRGQRRLESDWSTEFFRKQHTPAAFQNSLTSNIIMTIEKMLGMAGKQIKQIINYKKF